MKIKIKKIKECEYFALSISDCIILYIFIFIFETNLTSTTFASGILCFHHGR
jgi:hypothetical protein